MFFIQAVLTQASYYLVPSRSLLRTASLRFANETGLPSIASFAFLPPVDHSQSRTRELRWPAGLNLICASRDEHTRR